MSPLRLARARIGRPARPLVFLAALGCAAEGPPPMSDPPPGFPLAYAMWGCAPWDGAATTIYLAARPLDPAAPLGSEVPRPHVWISIYDTPASLAGRRHEIDQDRVAGAMRCLDAPLCEPAVSGWIRIARRAPEGDLKGDFALELDGGDRVAGGFDATWHDRPVLCG